MKAFPLIAGFVLVTSPALAQAPTSNQAPEAGHVIIASPDKVTWGPGPAALPTGASLAVLEGDPGKAGPFTMRLRVPDGYRIPPHFHPVVEHVTVINGTFMVGLGEKFDASKLTKLPAGTFAALDPGMRHFAQAEGETVLQLHGVGPWGLTYVNPKDDPRSKGK